MKRFVTPDEMHQFNPVMAEVCAVYRRVLELGVNDSVEFGIGIVPPEGTLQIVVKRVPKRRR